MDQIRSAAGGFPSAEAEDVVEVGLGESGDALNGPSGADGTGGPGVDIWSDPIWNPGQETIPHEIVGEPRPQDLLYRWVCPRGIWLMIGMSMGRHDISALQGSHLLSGVSLQ